MNRLQKVLEGANIKLSSVIQDSSGKRARWIIREDIPDGEEVSQLIHRN